MKQEGLKRTARQFRKRLGGLQGCRHRCTLLPAAGSAWLNWLALNAEDVDLCNGTVRVIGKGQKERMVPLCEPALKAIQAYLKEARDQCGRLFISKLRKRTSTRSIWLSLRKYVSKISIRFSSVLTSFGTLSPLTFWTAAPACAAFRNSLVMPAFQRDRFTRMFLWPGSKRRMMKFIPGLHKRRRRRQKTKKFKAVQKYQPDLAVQNRVLCWSNILQFTVC